MKFNNDLSAARYWRNQATKLAKGVLELADLAMPDTYRETDSRCIRARQVIEDAKNWEPVDDDQRAYERSQQHALSQIPPSLRAPLPSKKRKKKHTCTVDCVLVEGCPKLPKLSPKRKK